MGQEKDCVLRQGKRRLKGRAQLETDFILFRERPPGNGRLKIDLQDLKRVVAEDGVLALEWTGASAAMELGSAAAKWAEKILHPPTLADKLGIKPGVAVAIEGDFGEAILASAGPAVKGKSDLLFFQASESADLSRIERLKSRLKPSGAIWIVYPKGVKTIREAEVIAAGRAAGLKDTKVARFSESHTALRFSL